MAAAALSATSIFAGGPAFAASPAAASALTRAENTAVARHSTPSGTIGTTDPLQRCRWVRRRQAFATMTGTAAVTAAETGIAAGTGTEVAIAAETGTAAETGVVTGTAGRDRDWD